MAATKLSSLAVQISAIGVDQVKSAMRELGGTAESTSNRMATHYGKAARSLTLITNEAVRAGEIGGSALQKILTIGGDMAGMFGVGGAVVGAVSIAGLAIFNFFDRTRKEMEKTAEDAISLMRRVRDESGVSGLADLNLLKSGDPLSEDKRLRMGSLPDLEARKTKLQSEIRPLLIGASGMTIGGATREQASQLKQLNDEIERRTGLMRQLTPLIEGNLTAENRSTIATQRAAEAERSARAAETARQAAAERAAAAYVPPVRGQMPGVGLRSSTATGGVPMALVSARPDDLIQAQFQQWKASLLNPFEEFTKTIAATVRGGLASTLGDAVFQGFSSAFSGKGLGGLFKSFGKTVLAGIGGIFGQLGHIWLAYGLTMFKLGKWLWTPHTAGWAALGIGAALMAMSAALGAAGSSGGAIGGGGGGGPSSAVPEITNIKLTPTSVADAARLEPRTGNTYVIIGQDDPAAQRMLRDMVAKAERG